MGYNTYDFARMEILKKKYPNGVKCDWCEHNNNCPYPKATVQLTHNCCDFKDSRKGENK